MLFDIDAIRFIGLEFVDPKGFFVKPGECVDIREVIYSNYMEVMYTMVGFVEVSRHRCVPVVQYTMPVAVHALSKSLFCLAHILFFTSSACKEIYDPG